jgi:hypothetical protein
MTLTVLIFTTGRIASDDEGKTTVDDAIVGVGIICSGCFCCSCITFTNIAAVVDDDNALREAISASPRAAS